MNPQHWWRWQLRFTKIHFNKWWNNESTLTWNVPMTFAQEFQRQFYHSFCKKLSLFLSLRIVSTFCVGIIFPRQWHLQPFHVQWTNNINVENLCKTFLYTYSQGTVNANGAKVRLAWFFFCFGSKILVHDIEVNNPFSLKRTEWEKRFVPSTFFLFARL